MKAKNELRIRHSKYQSTFKNLALVSLIAWWAQCFAIYFLYCSMYKTRNTDDERKIPVMGWCLYAARMMFMIIILRIISSDTTSVWQSIAINRLKLDAAGKKKLSQIYLTMFNVPRYILNLASGAVICMHTLTIDGQGEETGFDLVKDFTALVIILEIDNVVSSIFI